MNVSSWVTLIFQTSFNNNNKTKTGRIIRPNKRSYYYNNPSWINNDVKQAIGRRQRPYETKRRTNNEETVAEYIEAKRPVKRIVKQGKT